MWVLWLLHGMVFLAVSLIPPAQLCGAGGQHPLLPVSLPEQQHRLTGTLMALDRCC